MKNSTRPVRVTLVVLNALMVVLAIICSAHRAVATNYRLTGSSDDVGKRSEVSQFGQNSEVMPILNFSSDVAVAKSGDSQGFAKSIQAKNPPITYRTSATKYKKVAASISNLSPIASGTLVDDAVIERIFQDQPNGAFIDRVVGSAEGNRQPNGKKNGSWFGHKDPGKGLESSPIKNLGDYSYRHHNNDITPEQANSLQRAKLKKTAARFLQQARDKNIQLTVEEFLNWLDLFDQSEAAAAYFFNRLVEAHEKGIAAADAGNYARKMAFCVDTSCTAIDASGLADDPVWLQQDQDRRSNQISKTIVFESGATEQPRTESVVASEPRAPETKGTLVAALPPGTSDGVVSDVQSPILDFRPPTDKSDSLEALLIPPTGQASTQRPSLSRPSPQRGLPPQVAPLTHVTPQRNAATDEVPLVPPEQATQIPLVSIAVQPIVVAEPGQLPPAIKLKEEKIRGSLSTDHHNEDTLDLRLAKIAEFYAGKLDSTGLCACGVNNSLAVVGIDSLGGANDVFQKLLHDNRFEQIPLDKAGPGTIIYRFPKYPLKSGYSWRGHIIIIATDGREASDHLSHDTSEAYAEAYAFRLKSSSIDLSQPFDEKQLPAPEPCT